mgnify:FL=1
MRITAIIVFIFFGVISLLGLLAIDETLFSFILGICVFIGGSVSGLLTFMDQAEEGTRYQRAYYKIVDENRRYEKVILILNDEIEKLKQNNSWHLKLDVL